MVENIISQILEKYSRVVLPNLGELKVLNTSTLFSNNQINPPQTKVVFDPTSKINDGILNNFVSKHFNLDFENGILKTNELIEELNKKLIEGEIIIFPNIGKMQYKNSSFEIIEQSNTFDNYFFGLQNVDLKDNNIDKANLYVFSTSDNNIQPQYLESTNQSNTNTEQPKFIYIAENANDNSESKINFLPNVEIVEQKTTISNEPKIDENIIGEKSKDGKSDESQLIDNIEPKFEDNNTIIEEKNDIIIEEDIDIIEENLNTTNIDIEKTNDEFLIGEEEGKISDTNIESKTHDGNNLFDEPAENDVFDNLLKEIPELFLNQKDETKHSEVNEEYKYKSRLSKYSNQDNKEYSNQDNNDKKWFSIIIAILLFFTIAIIAPWIYCSFKCKDFIGMAPLWDNCKKIEKKKQQLATNTNAKVDTLNKDTLDNIKKDTTKLSNIKDLTNSNSTPSTQNINNKVGSTNTNSTQTVSSTSSLNTSKRKAENNFTLKSIENSVRNNKSTIASTPKRKDSSKAKTISINKEKEKIDEENLNVLNIKGSEKKIISASMKGTTANYKKGNSYLCFGTFKSLKAASSLRNNLKKLGVVTENILVDETYRIVIPYSARKHAEKASESYPNTIIFD